MANITLQPNDGALKSTLTITKQNNSQLTLNTANTFTDQNIQLTFNVQSGSLNIGGGELSKGDGIATLANAGYYNGSTYNTSDVIDITTQTTEASGYYKITASGYGKVDRAAITKQVRTAGWLAQDTSAVINSAAITGYTSNTGTHDYYIKKSTLSTDTITSSNNNQTITVYKGYYPTDRTITINGMENGDYGVSVSYHAITTKPVITPSIGGNITSITTTTEPVYGTNGTDYWTIDPEGSVTTNGQSRANGKATITKSGYLALDSTGKTTSNHNIDITSSNITIANGTNRYLLKANISKTDGTATATATNGIGTITKQPTASASTAITPNNNLSGGYYTDGTQSDYFITVSAQASSASGTVRATGGNASASVTASSITIGAGYNPTSVITSTNASSTGTKTGTVVETTEVTANKNTSQTIYLKAAGFSNTPTSGITYTEISKADFPFLNISQSEPEETLYLYINNGFIPNTKISIDTLIPDFDAQNYPKMALDEHILDGYVAYKDDGTILVGTIKDLNATTYNVSSSDTIIPAGKYLAGDQTIRAIKITEKTGNNATANIISASSIKKGMTIQIGDAGNATRILNVAGTFTEDGTQSSGQSVATVNHILTGYSAWVNGEEIIGAIPIRTSANVIVTASNNKIEVAGGYYASKVETSMSAGTVKSGSANITSATYTYDASISTTTFTVTGSATVSAPTVPTTGAGYVSSTVGTKQTNVNGATLNTTVNKIAIKANNSGTTTKKPVIAKQAISISGVTDAANGNATTTAPSSGVYIAVKSPANTGTLTSKPTVTTTGYGTADNGTTAGIYTATDATSTVGAEASDMTYVPIKTANPTFTGGSLTVTSSMAVSPNTNSTVIISDTDTCGAYISSTGSVSRAAVTYASAVDGYVIKDSGAIALAATASNTDQGTATKKYINGIKIYAPSGDTERYFDVTVPNGSTTEFITFRFKVDKNGNVTVEGI